MKIMNKTPIISLIIVIIVSILYGETSRKLSFNVEPSFTIVPYKKFITFGGTLKIGVQNKCHFFGLTMHNVKENYVIDNLKLMGGFINYSNRKIEFKEILFIYPEIFLGYGLINSDKMSKLDEYLGFYTIDSKENFIIGGVGINGGFGYKISFLTFGYNLLIGNIVVNSLSFGIKLKVNIK